MNVVFTKFMDYIMDQYELVMFRKGQIRILWGSIGIVKINGHCKDYSLPFDIAR